MKKDSATPLYDQLVTVLMEYIKTSLNVDDKMLSERKKKKKYDVSRTTVRATLNELEEMGFIYKRHGKGTYVSGLWKEMQDLSNYYSFTEQMKKLGKEPKTDIVSFERLNAIPYVAENLGLQANDDVYKLRRLRSADGLKMMYETTFIPAYLFPSLTVSQLESMPLYELYPTLYKQDIRYAEEEFYASVAEAKEAERLDIQEGSACLRIFRKTYNQDNKIVEFTLSVARGDQFIYKIRHVNK